jgi:sugar phosphate isomerase/epimerase
MRVALCNEVVRELEFEEQCGLAAALGYEGLEIAPFTLAEDPHLIPLQRRHELRRMAEDAGLQITGLHWLLVSPKGLSVTSRDTLVRERTLDVMKRLVELCSDLGGEVLIHGSPQQRLIADDDDPVEARDRAVEIFSAVAESAREVGVLYCIEALNQEETNFVNRLSEGITLVEEINNPAFRTMLDTKAASFTETDSVPDLLDRWLPEGMIAHVHVNDRNLRGPGQGQYQFAPVFAALLRNHYEGVIGVEPFEYYPDGRTAAARAIGYIQGILECLEI